MKSLCNLAKQIGPLAGRLLLANIFIVSGFKKIAGFGATAGYMASKGLPMAEVLLVLTILIELGGGVLILLGWQARWAAVAVLLWMLPVTFIFHAYWGLESDQMRMQFIQFQKNLAIMGGLIYIVAFGSGPYSLKRDQC
jgi:putative oxidoreductase